MIREIAARSGGTQIKILSNKSAEKDSPEIVVSIAGNLRGKQDAASIILEQIELFKNGGPVLTTGSCLNDNIATQYKNSVQGQENSTPKGIKERRKSRESSSDSSKRGRSRSSSLEERYTRRKESETNKVSESRNLVIHPKDVNLIRAQLNNEFYNKPIPFPPSLKSLPISGNLNQNSMQESFLKQSLNPENRQEESKIPEVPPVKRNLEEEKLESSHFEKPKEEEVRVEETLGSKSQIEADKLPNAQPQKYQSNFCGPTEMDSILNMKIQKVKTNFKLTLLFENYSEGIRFKDCLDIYNKNHPEQLEYSVLDLGQGKGRSFTLKSTPSIIAEIIKEHGNKELN